MADELSSAIYVPTETAPRCVMNERWPPTRRAPSRRPVFNTNTHPPQISRWFLAPTRKKIHTNRQLENERINCYRSWLKIERRPRKIRVNFKGRPEIERHRMIGSPSRKRANYSVVVHLVSPNSPAFILMDDEIALVSSPSQLSCCFDPTVAGRSATIPARNQNKTIIHFPFPSSSIDWILW